MRKSALLICLLIWAVLCAGCGVRSTFRLRDSGSFAATPDGPCAVLRVTREPHGPSRTGKTTWGKLHTPSGGQVFAERLAYIAHREGGLEVIPAPQVTERLEEAGAEPTLQPTDEQLRAYAEALGLNSYLTAHLERSELHYRWFWQWAVVSFDLACHRAEDDELIWRVEVLRQGRFVSDRELTTDALTQTFQHLREKESPGGETK